MQSNQLLYNAIISSAADLAEKGALEQINVYLTIGGAATAIVIAILGFLGYSQFRDIRTTLAQNIRNELAGELRNSADFRRTIRSEIEADLLSDIGKDIARLERLIDIGRLSSLSQKVLESDSFTNAERDSLLQSLVNLKEDANVVATPEYQEALVASITSFYAAGLWSHLERLDNELSAIITSSIRMAGPMMEAYALQSLGEIAITEEEAKQINERLLSYIRSVRDLKFSESAYPFLLAYELWKNGRSQLTDRIIASASDLKPEEAQVFIESIYRRADLPTTLAEKDLRSELIVLSKKFQTIRAEYGAELKLLEQRLQ